MREAAAQGAQLSVFGEIFLNGYGSGPRSAKFAILESTDEPHVQEIANLAGELNQTVVIGATTYKRERPNECYNSALVIDGDGLRGVYNKTHVPNIVGPKGEIVSEATWWASGEDIAPIKTNVGSLGIHICYDFIFPGVTRTLAVQGADLLINVTAAVCGYESTWDAFLPVRSAENAMPYVHVSIVGEQGELSCFGGSRVYSASGTVLGELPRNEEGLTVVTIDLDETRLVRSAIHTYSLRKPALYEAIAQAH